MGAASPMRAGGVYVMGVVAMIGAYPPLVLGLVPAGVAMTRHIVPRRHRSAAGVAAALASALLLIGVFITFRARLEHLAFAMGEFATPLPVSVLMAALTGLLTWTAWKSGVGWSALRGLAAAVGYSLAATGVAVAAVMFDRLPWESYYSVKLAEAAWLAALPVFAAITGWGLHSMAAKCPQPAAALVLTGGIVAAALVVSLLPVGRSQGTPVGPTLLAQRLKEADRSAREASLVRSRTWAAAADKDVLLVVSPSG